MRGIMLVAALAACSSDPPPSCQEAIGHYYGAGCTYYDTSTGSAVAITEVDMINRCTNAASVITDNCKGALDAWLSCNDGVMGTQACASCSSEYMTLIECH